jgi:hypothetical protein
LLLAVPFAGDVTLKVYNVRGEVIWNWPFSASGQGYYPVYWDCKNPSGSRVSYGEYYAAAHEQGTNGLKRDHGRWMAVLH